MKSLLFIFSLLLSFAALTLAFSFKTKVLNRLQVNMLIGAAVVGSLSAVGFIPLNAINVFTVGLLGLPGLAAISVIVKLL